jgi:hypothetical protein
LLPERRSRMSRSRGGVRRSEAEWKRVVEGFERSGLSRLAYCRREGIARGSLERWRAKVGSSGVPGFVELATSRGKPEGWAVEVELPSGVVLRVRG